MLRESDTLCTSLLMCSWANFSTVSRMSFWHDTGAITTSPPSWPPAPPGEGTAGEPQEEPTLTSSSASCLTSTRDSRKLSPSFEEEEEEDEEERKEAEEEEEIWSFKEWS